MNEKTNKLPEKIYFERNGMTCWYYSENLDSLPVMKTIVQELDSFVRTFFDNGECSWVECLNDSDIVEIFLDYNFLNNDFADKVLHKLDMANLQQEPLSCEEACKQVRNEEKGE